MRTERPKSTAPEDPSATPRPHLLTIAEAAIYLNVALSAALAATPGGAERRFFAGPGVVIGQYRVHPVVAVLTSRWDELPHLKPRRDHSLFAYPSLQNAVIVPSSWPERGRWPDGSRRRRS